MQDERCREIIKTYQAEQGSVISLLQDIQGAFGYIPEDVVLWLSKELNIPASNFFGVATFYSQFYLSPRGKNILTICCGTACHVKGSAAVIGRVRRELALSDGEDTTKDAQFTLESVACVGACSIAPVLIANDKVHGKVSPDMASSMLEDFREETGE